MTRLKYDEDKKYRLVFPGNVMPGTNYDEVVFELARLLKTSPESAIKLVSGIRRHVKRTFIYEKADQLRTQVLQIGVECELEPIDEGSGATKTKKHKRKKEYFPEPENLAMKPASSIEETDFDLNSDKTYSETMAEFQKHAIANRKQRTVKATLDEAGHSFNAESEQGEAHGAEGEALKNTRRRFAQFVGSNLEKYLPEFDKYMQGGSSHFVFTWHWPALFVPFLWAIYRKLWGWSILMFVSFILLPLLSNIIWAATANYIYYRHSEKAIKSIRYKYPENIDEKLSQKGGTSTLALSGALLLILLLMNGVYWTSSLSPVFSTLSDNLEKLEQTKIPKK